MLTLWNPINGLTAWSRELDRFFGEGSTQVNAYFSPKVDVAEHEDKFLIRADLPGVAESDIEISVNDGKLVLSGKREASKEEKTDHGYYRERSYGSFCRSFELGDTVDAEKIEAKMDKGVLEVVLPKKERAKPKLIPVKGN